MLNPVFTYMLDIWFVNTFCRYRQLNDLFLTIKFCIIQSQMVLCIAVCVCVCVCVCVQFVSEELVGNVFKRVRVKCFQILLSNANNSI